MSPHDLAYRAASTRATDARGPDVLRRAWTAFRWWALRVRYPVTFGTIEIEEHPRRGLGLGVSVVGPVYPGTDPRWHCTPSAVHALAARLDALRPGECLTLESNDGTMRVLSPVHTAYLRHAMARWDGQLCQLEAATPKEP